MVTLAASVDELCAAEKPLPDNFIGQMIAQLGCGVYAHANLNLMIHDAFISKPFDKSRSLLPTDPSRRPVL